MMDKVIPMCRFNSLAPQKVGQGIDLYLQGVDEVQDWGLQNL